MADRRQARREQDERPVRGGEPLVVPEGTVFPVKASTSLCQGRDETTTAASSAQCTISLLRKSRARVEVSCPAHLPLERGMWMLSEKPLSSMESKMPVVPGG
jgi:hypothetical protein